MLISINYNFWEYILYINLYMDIKINNMIFGKIVKKNKLYSYILIYSKWNHFISSGADLNLFYVRNKIEVKLLQFKYT